MNVGQQRKVDLDLNDNGRKTTIEVRQQRKREKR